MKKAIAILSILLGIGLSAAAQKEYRLAKSAGHLKLNLFGATIEGYEGKEIIFLSGSTATGQTDQRAKGLEALATSGLKDNTGMGLSIKENGQEISVENVFSDIQDLLTIKVPRGMKVSFTSSRNQHYEDILIRNIKGEIEVAAQYNKIKLENNSGPMNISSINGPVEAIFQGDVKGPISIVSVRDYVDITLPASTSANLELATNYGKLYASKEFEVTTDRPANDKTAHQATFPSLTGAISPNSGAAAGPKPNGSQGAKTQSAAIGYGYGSGEQVNGKLNGGGTALIFKSINGNVYLRHK